MLKDFIATFSHIWGPYMCKSGRKQVGLRYWSGKRRTVSYPKFLVECVMERALDPTLETIDHIDRDLTNDAWENLRVLPINVHTKEDAPNVVRVSTFCVECGKPIEVHPRLINHNARIGRAGPFCGHECSGTYAQKIQMGGVALPSPTYTPVVLRPKVAVSNVADLAKKKRLTEAKILAAIADKQQGNIPPPKPDVVCEVCGKAVPSKDRWKYCSQDCAHEALRRATWPSPEELHELVWSMPTRKVAKKFGVSDQAVAKWCRKMGIEKPPRGYWNKIQAEEAKQLAKTYEQ